MEPMWAIILDPWKEEPVYHAVDGVRVNHTQDFSKCGRAISVHKPWLPMKHVKKFARPCKGCFSA